MTTSDDSVLAGGRTRKELKTAFAEDGYVLLEGMIDRQRLSDLTAELRREYADVTAAGRLFVGGGTFSGHLNCFPGAESRFVHDTLAERGVLDLVQELSSGPLKPPNVGCNFNLSGSSPQNEHVDGYAEQPFLVVNIAAVDTDRRNGAMEVLCRTHRRSYRYWEVMLARPRRIRLTMKQGDIVIRTSALWHRGMPNESAFARPMLALTWEDGGSVLPDPYRAHDGRITFLPNRHRTDWSGQLRERAFVAAPRIGTAFRVVQSMLESI